MAQPIQFDDQTPAPRGPLLIAIAATVAAAGVGITDAVLASFDLPAPLDNAVGAAMIGPWVLYFQARSHHLLTRRMGAVEWADGFVHGVARRTPPNERVRWMDD